MNTLTYSVYNVLRLLGIASFGLFLVWPLCLAEENKPFLRLNPMMHTDIINQISVHPSRTLIATASDDKTLRLWGLRSGRLMRTIRPPIHEGNEGKLFALAFSPNGSVIAAGGWAKGEYRGFGNHNIYLFRQANGELIDRISGLENVVLHLDFSPNGKLITAALAGQNGIRIWKSNMTEVLRDMDYAGDSYWVEFSPDGKQLISTCDDGYIRFYKQEDKSENFTFLDKINFEDYPKPFAARFSPDGEKIAISFINSTKVAIISAKTLDLLYWTPSEPGIGDIFTVTWDKEGKTLYGAGGFKTQGLYSILQWSNEGKNLSKIWPAAWNLITDLQILSNNNLIFSTASPSWGVFTPKGQEIMRYDREMVYFNKIFPQGLLVSHNAQTVEFEHDTLQKKIKLHFSLEERRLIEISLENTTSPLPIEEKTLTLLEVQQKLTKNKYYSGALDGKLGPRTKAAIQRYQKENNLPITGVVDQSMMQLLQEKQKNPEEIANELQPPALTIPDMEMKSWKNSAQPLLNGKPLVLHKNDTAISYAFVPNGESVVLGTRFGLYHYDRKGKLLWQVTAPGIVWAVNVAGNGKIVIGAFDDGTIRWYNLTDGSELLALYCHADQHRWIAWMPNGIYAASVGADTLLGWHVNNSYNENGDFYPIRSVRQFYYQPETLIQSLAKVDQKKSQEILGETPLIDDLKETSTEVELEPPYNFPPRIILLSPLDNSQYNTSEVSIKYKLRFHGESSDTDLRVMLNGRPWRLFKNIQKENADSQEESTNFHLELPLPPLYRAELAFITENEYGISPPESLLLRWGQDITKLPEPNLYVLAIGISEYQDENIQDLSFVESDINDFIEKLTGFSDQWKKSNGGNYYDVQIKKLLNSNYSEIMKGLSWLRKNAAKAEDVSIILFMGHSLQYTDLQKNEYFFLPEDATAQSNTISSSILMETFREIAGKVIIFIDTAHFSLIKNNSARLSHSDVDGFANELSSPENGIIIFSSTIGDQASQQTEDKTHSIFIMSLLDALEGKADFNQDNQLKLQEIGDYISKNVHELTNGKQTPILAMPKTIRDFSIRSVNNSDTNTTKKSLDYPDE